MKFCGLAALRAELVHVVLPLDVVTQLGLARLEWMESDGIGARWGEMHRFA